MEVWESSAQTSSVINRLDPIEELYDMYSEEGDTPRIVEVRDNDLDFVSDIKGLAGCRAANPGDRN